VCFHFLMWLGSSFFSCVMILGIGIEGEWGQKFTRMWIINTRHCTICFSFFLHSFGFFQFFKGLESENWELLISLWRMNFSLHGRNKPVIIWHYISLAIIGIPPLALVFAVVKSKFCHRIIWSRQTKFWIQSHSKINT